MSEKKQRPYKHPQINLRIPEELKEKIQGLADKNGRSMNAEIVTALDEYISKYTIGEHSDGKFYYKKYITNLDKKNVISKDSFNIAKLLYEMEKQSSEYRKKLLAYYSDAVDNKDKK